MVERIDVTDKMLAYSRELARHADATAIMVCVDAFADPRPVRAFAEQDHDTRVVFVTKSVELLSDLENDQIAVLQVPNVRLTRSGQIKLAILVGFGRGLFSRWDRLVCLSGIAKSGVLDTLVFMEVADEFELFAASAANEITEHVHTEVFERVLDIAVALANEGREGKPVGSTLVLGDSEQVLKQSSQMILNPFRGYSEEERNILDSSLERTVKELSAIDGAFVIRGDGVIETAGAYLRSTATVTGLPRGLGARHYSAASITASTKATAITISESTGTVTVYRGGKIVIEIEPPRPIGPRTEQTVELLRDAPALSGAQERVEDFLPAQGEALTSPAS